MWRPVPYIPSNSTTWQWSRPERQLEPTGADKDCEVRNSWCFLAQGCVEEFIKVLTAFIMLLRFIYDQLESSSLGHLFLVSRPRHVACNESCSQSQTGRS